MDAEKPGSMEFSKNGTEKMKEPCKNHIFYHVEIEFIGNHSNLYEHEKSDEPDFEPIGFPEWGPDQWGPGDQGIFLIENYTRISPRFYPCLISDNDVLSGPEHPDDDELNPKLLKIRKATLLDWELTSDGKEKIWFDKPPQLRDP